MSHADDPSSGAPEGFDKFLVSEESESDELIARRQAAELGDADAQYRVARHYKYGSQTVKKSAKAVRWYRKAAAQGHVKAQFFLGESYAMGDGVEEDLAEAVRWYRKAAEQGDPYASERLYRCYKSGDGVEQDQAEAERWKRKYEEQMRERGEDPDGLEICHL